MKRKGSAHLRRESAHLADRGRFRARAALVLSAWAAAGCALAGPAFGTVTPHTAHLDDGSFSEFDSTNALNGDLVPETARIFEGAGSTHATYSGAGANGYSRGLWKVSWQDGDDIWYGGAYFLPPGFKSSMKGQVDLVRWDNWATDPNTTEKSGVVMYGSDKRARLVRMKQSVEQVALGNSFELPEGRWFRVDVHQRLSTTDPVNEVYLDGHLISSSTEPNFYGNPAERIRYGIVAIGSAQVDPLELWFDEATVSTSQHGGGGPPTMRLVEFESGACADHFGGESSCGTYNGTFEPSTALAAAGARSAVASYDGGDTSGHARGQSVVTWEPGDDVTYSAYLRLDTGFAAAVRKKAHLLRWDNYASMPIGMEMGGVEVSGADDKARLFREKTGTEHATISSGFALPEGRWFQLQVRQRLSATDPVSEVFVDGELVASSIEPAFYGNTIDRLRYGLVHVSAQTAPLALHVDSVSAP